MNKNKDGFIVAFWERIFKGLSYVSLFAFVSFLRKKYFKKVGKKDSGMYGFVECWVIGNLAASICASLLVYHTTWMWFAVIVSTYGILRIFEIVVYQINVMLFDPYRAMKEKREYAIKSPTRLVVLLMHNYVEIIFWFTTATIFYLNSNGLIEYSWAYYLQINFLCITTFDTSEMIHRLSGESLFLMVTFFESVVGFLMTVISLARFIGLLPSVKSIDKM